MIKYPGTKIEKRATLKEFLDFDLAELLPNQDIMIKNHLNLIEYLESESPLFLLRKFKNNSNRGSFYSFEKHQFTVSDNEPALWVFMESFYNTELDFFDIIQNQKLPIAFAVKKEEKPENRWKNIGRKHKDFSENGWKHCHIFQCSPLRKSILSENDLKRRSLRLLSPLNHFPFFSPKKHEMPSDYGENKQCIEYVIWWLYNKFYSDSNKSYFKTFVEEQNFTIPVKEPQDIKIDYSIKNKIQLEKDLEYKKDKVQKSKHSKPIGLTQLIVESKYFFIKRNKLGDNIIIRFKDNKGIIWHYDHDLVYEKLQYRFDTMQCFITKKEYTSNKSVPSYVQELDCVSNYKNLK
jgi:hypothetical protein